jgi:hypothetical protein
MATKMTSPISSDPIEWPYFVGEWPRLTGRQEPRFASAFDGDESWGDAASKLAYRIGMRQMPWQWQTTRKILSRQPDSLLWTHGNVCLVCVRQVGKTEIALVRILFGLFVGNERIIFSANRWLTSERVFQRLKAAIERRPSLYRRLAKDPATSSSRAYIELKSGASITLGVRSGDLGRGLDRVDLLVLDECQNLTDPEVGALAPTQLASPNPQTIYLSTPADIDTQPNCLVIAGIRRKGHAREPGLLFAEWGAKEDMAREDPATWSYAIPSYGEIHTEAKVRSLLSKAVTPDGLRLFDADLTGKGNWPPDESELGSVISAETWADLKADTPPELVGPIAIAVDRSNDRKTWAIASARRTVEGRVHVEIAPYELSTNADVVEKLIEIVCDWDPIEIAIDQRSAAAVIQPALEAVDIQPRMTNTTELVLACGSWLDAVEAGIISHSDQQALNDAVVSAVKRDLAGGFAWQTAPGVTNLVAASLAAWSLISATQDIPKHTPPPMCTQPDYDSSYDNVVELDLMNTKF